ncbi:GCR1-dependent translation factor 1, partial [Teratosphaeriaceae sp. CCFEE 6253]
SEQERIAAGQGKAGAAAGGGSEKTKPPNAAKKEAEREAKGADAQQKKKGGEYGAGGYGMEKPTDLPEKPHNLPHPDPKGASLADTSGSTSKSDAGPPVSPPGNKEAWLQNTMPYTEGQKAAPPPAPLSPLPAGSPPATTAPDLEWHEWFHSFILSLAMILVSEI